MKAGWEKNKLGDVLAVLRNGVNCKQDKDGKGEKISRIESIADATFNPEKVGYAALSATEKERYRLLSGDILFSHINSAIHVGKTAIFNGEEEVFHGVNLLLMRPKPEVVPAYLNYALKLLFQSGYWKRACKQSVNQASVNQQDISKVEIQYPYSIAEQHRIVAILDEAFDGIATTKANAEKNLQNARALFESHLQSVFTERGEGWVEKSLEDVVDAQCTLSYGIVQPGHEYTNGMPVVRPTDLTAKVITLDGLKRIDPKLADGYRRTTLRGGDLLLCVRGSTGVVSVTAPELAGANVTRGIVPIVFAPALLRQDFGYFLMTSEAVQSQIRAKTYGAALMQINIGDLRKIAVAFPSLQEQKAMTAKLEELSAETQRLESLYQQKLTALDDLKKSLLHQAFSGQL
jgi:type I restriction enzyme S subunit